MQPEVEGRRILFETWRLEFWIVPTLPQVTFFLAHPVYIREIKRGSYEWAYEKWFESSKD